MSALVAVPAHAQLSDVLTVVARTPSDSPPQAVLSQLRAVMLDGQRVRVGMDAAESFRDHGTRPPSSRPSDVGAQLREAVGHAASGELEQALDLASELVNNAERRLDAIGVRDQSARAVLDACLVMLRVHLAR